MDITTIKQPLDIFIKRLKQDIKLKRVIVFGSYSENRASKYSDVDAIVVSDDFEKIRDDQRVRYLDDITENIKPTIQAWGVTQKELDAAGKLSTLGNARDHGYQYLRFVLINLTKQRMVF